MSWMDETKYRSNTITNRISIMTDLTRAIMKYVWSLRSAPIISFLFASFSARHVFRPEKILLSPFSIRSFKKPAITLANIAIKKAENYHPGSCKNFNIFSMITFSF
jgi:hypothetical protein